LFFTTHDVASAGLWGEQRNPNVTHTRPATTRPLLITLPLSPRSDWRSAVADVPSVHRLPSLAIEARHVRGRK
jgi:hypothetical protein